MSARRHLRIGPALLRCLPRALSNLLSNLWAIPKALQAAASMARSLFPLARANCLWYIFNASSISPIFISTSPILPKALNFPIKIIAC